MTSSSRSSSRNGGSSVRKSSSNSRSSSMRTSSSKGGSSSVRKSSSKGSRSSVRTAPRSSSGKISFAAPPSSSHNLVKFQPIVISASNIGFGSSEVSAEYSDLDIESIDGLVNLVDDLRLKCNNQIDEYIEDFVEINAIYNQITEQCLREKNMNVISLIYSNGNSGSFKQSEFYIYIDALHESVINQAKKLDKKELSDEDYILFFEEFKVSLHNLLEKLFA